MKRILLVVAALLLTASTALFAQGDLDKIKALLDQKLYREAIAASKTYLDANPREAKGWQYLAQACWKIRNLDSAEMAAKNCLQYDDEAYDGYVTLIDVQLAKNQVADAYATARKGLRMGARNQPKYPPLLVAFGETLIAQDSADAALIAGSQARELDPNNPGAYEVMGDAYAKQKVAPMAVDSYEKSLQIDSTQTRVLYKLANTYTADRRYTPAARVYSRILALDPGNDSARIELAGLLFRAQQFSTCAQVLTEYFKTHKNPPETLQSIYLDALYRSRYFNEAYPIANEYLKAKPNSPLALRAIASFHVIVDKKYSQAIETYKKLETLDTLDFDDYYRLGYAYRQTKKDSLAIVTYEAALKDTLQPAGLRANMYGELGSLLMNLEKWEPAAESFEKRFDLDTSAIGALINYASCMMQLEKFQNAISALRRAIVQNPKFPPSYVKLGFCYYQMKDYDNGRKEFDDAVHVIDTQEVKYRYELADSYRMIGLAVMLRKETDPDASKRKWEEAVGYLKKSLKAKEDVAQTHVWLGQCYQNLNKIDDAIIEYRRALKLDPKNKEAKQNLETLLKIKGQ